MKCKRCSFLFLCASTFCAISYAVPTVELVYHNYTFLTAEMQRLNEVYPDISSLYSIGQSIKGRNLWVLAIAGSSSEAHQLRRPEVKYVGNMHGNEVIGREVLLHFIENLLKGYNNDNDITEFLDNTRIHVLPSMNPDGFEMSIEGECDGTEGRGNANGIDLNRNFPDYFREPEDELQQETQLIMNWLKTEQFVLSANFHGGALLANYPLDHMEPAKYDTFVALSDNSPYSAGDYDDIMRYVALTYTFYHTTMRTYENTMCDITYPGSGFNLGITNGADWYVAVGGMQDYNYYKAGCFEITLELSCCKYPNASELPSFWEENEEPLFQYVKQVHRGIKGIIRASTSSAPLEGATVKVINREPARFTTAGGEYWLVLLPGQYSVQVSMEGYETQIKTVTVVSDLYKVATLDFELEQEAESLTECGGAGNTTPTLSLLMFAMLSILKFLKL